MFNSTSIEWWHFFIRRTTYSPHFHLFNIFLISYFAICGSTIFVSYFIERIGTIFRSQVLSRGNHKTSTVIWNTFLLNSCARAEIIFVKILMSHHFLHCFHVLDSMLISFEYQGSTVLRVTKIRSMFIIFFFSPSFMSCLIEIRDIV